ncbi:EF-P beta-lysylation protein EpmB [Xylella fastidiosa]|uniref:L-lysine 2,3-aminomutase n=1 Tax=Xylella fastidiosa subsp. fastidiosa TaxID=644356 RepID=A0AAJ5QZP4_XYLFS|nr:EF-P beta-lysylation protein EpmB [Xylella fastidiosa]WCF27600.1 EF-P beta-lysylation protein EpmB [Xylella fastidiosa subsp. fastidiosa]
MITAAPVPLQPSTASPLQPPRWQQVWREAIRDPRELLALLKLDPTSVGMSEAAAAQFPLRVPRGFVARMRVGDLHDPLLRQVLPMDAEQDQIAGFGVDAVGDGAAKQATGIIQKYQGRILLIATGSCAVHCRYCFRRHFPYAEDTASHDRWQEAAAFVRADPSIEEVILSGGDPLSLSTAKLVELTDALRGTPHLKRLRIHSRLPVVLPERIDTPLLEWLSALPWPVAFVIHANHANEFDASVDAALAALRGVGTQLLNQAVLLRGVNDNINALAALSERSFAAGVLPYYLHQLDRIAGTAHYEVEDARARTLHAELVARLSGYLVPRFVREVPGDSSKRPL